MEISGDRDRLWSSSAGAADPCPLKWIAVRRLIANSRVSALVSGVIAAMKVSSGEPDITLFTMGSHTRARVSGSIFPRSR